MELRVRSEQPIQPPATQWSRALETFVRSQSDLTWDAIRARGEGAFDGPPGVTGGRLSVWVDRGRHGSPRMMAEFVGTVADGADVRALTRAVRGDLDETLIETIMTVAMEGLADMLGGLGLGD